MDWNNASHLTTPNFVSSLPQSSSALLYNYHYNYDYNFDHFPAVETKRPAVEAQQQEQGVVVGVDQKKKRLSHDQLESLERSFQEEVKLHPDRKMKLSKELGLQPRQIAVWFQNRRARWKGKQLEHLYDTLKQEFDTVSREKHDLQQEVMKLRSMLREQAARNQVSMAYTDVSGEEAAEIENTFSNNYILDVENVNQISASSTPSTPSTPSFCWRPAEPPHLPSYP